MTHHVTAIERRNRDEIEDTQHDIDDHHFDIASRHNGTRSELVSAEIRPERTEDDLLVPAARASLYHDQNQHGASRNHKVADRARPPR